MSKSWRIAIASLDGKVVNEHFGRAKAFIITDIDEKGSITRIEKREVQPLCQSGEHTENGLSESIRSLSDCTAVLVAQIGTYARRALELNHISVFEHADYIENALAKLARYLSKTDHSDLEVKNNG